MFGFWQANSWTWAWLVWGVAFLAIELPAAWLSYHGHPGGTLSEHVWAAISGGSRGAQVRKLAFALFWCWLTLHFFLEWL